MKVPPFSARTAKRALCADLPARIVEVGPRDGLQNEKAVIPTETKIAFVNTLSCTGVAEIEVSAFVAPEWMPQLSDADQVFERIERVPGVVYSALVPNEKGLERALRARADKIAVFTAASQTFNRKNVNCSIEESLERFRPVIERARALDLPVRGYVSTAFWCPYEGRISPGKTVEVAARLVDLGAQEVAIADTTGRAAPGEVKRLLDLLLLWFPAGEVAMHFHDTYGRALDNIRTAWERGVRTFDASVGGLGGCPYAPGATGNVATEEVVRGLRDQGVRVSVDLKILTSALNCLVNRQAEGHPRRCLRAELMS